MRNYSAELVSLAAQMNWYGGTHLPVLLVGEPGTAKTTFIKGLARELTGILQRKKLLKEGESYYVADYVLPQTDPAAIEGLAAFSEDKEHVIRKPLMKLYELSKSKYGMIFGDELTSAQPETGAAFMTLVQDLVAGDLQLHSKVAPIFACNPPDQAAAGRELSPPEANRFMWLEWGIPHGDYLDYLRGGKGVLQHVRELPETWEAEHGDRARALVAAFLEVRSDLSNEMKTGEEHLETDATPPDFSTAWASQRSWYNLARVLAACLAIGEDLVSPMVRIAIKGCVGERAGNQFFTWLQDADLPNPKDLIKLSDEEIVETIMAIPRDDHKKACLEQFAVYSKSQYGIHGDIEVLRKATHTAFEIADQKKDIGYSSVVIVTTMPPGVQERGHQQQWLDTLSKWRNPSGDEKNVWLFKLRDELGVSL